MFNKLLYNYKNIIMKGVMKDDINKVRPQSAFGVKFPEVIKCHLKFHMFLLSTCNNKIQSRI